MRREKVGEGRYACKGTSHSPDLNPIELLWEDMDREIKKKKPTSLAGLEEVTRQVWSEISQEKLNKLIDRSIAQTLPSSYRG